jgi:hypothetical protein
MTAKRHNQTTFTTTETHIAFYYHTHTFTIQKASGMKGHWVAESVVARPDFA